MTIEELIKIWREQKPVVCCEEVMKEKDDGSCFFRQCNRCARVTDIFKYELFLDDK